LLARLAEDDGLRGALVSIDAIATNGTIAAAIRDAGANYLLAVKANQPTLQAEIEAFSVFIPASAGRRGSYTSRIQRPPSKSAERAGLRIQISLDVLTQQCVEIMRRPSSHFPAKLD
jgi:hypothetical protein